MPPRVNWPQPTSEAGIPSAYSKMKGSMAALTVSRPPRSTGTWAFPAAIDLDERIDGSINRFQASEVHRHLGVSGRNDDGTGGGVDLTFRGCGHRSLAGGIAEQNRAREGEFGGVGGGQQLWISAETSGHGCDRPPLIEQRDAGDHRIEHRVAALW